MVQKHQISLQFEKFTQNSPGGLENFIDMSGYFVKNNPEAITDLPFAKSSSVSSGVIEALPSEMEDAAGKGQSDNNLRLKSIRSPEGELLQHHYNKDGFLSRTVFGDRNTINYIWDKAGRLRNVSDAKSGGIRFDYIENRRQASVMYPMNNQFRYIFNATGNSLLVRFPDGKSVETRLDNTGQPDEIMFDGSVFTYKWDEKGNPAGIKTQIASKSYNLDAHTRSLAFPLDPVPDKSTGIHKMASPSGIWVYSSNGALLELITVDGGRYKYMPDARPNMDLLWEISGQTAYYYDSRGVLSSIFHSNGLRTVFFPVKGTRDVTKVSAGHAVLYQYGTDGRLIKTRGMDGQYEIYDYTKDGLISRISSAAGKLSFQYDNKKRISSISFSDGVSARIKYGDKKIPADIKIIWKGKQAMAAVAKILGTLWQWTAMKKTLRLEDPAMKEV